MLDDSTSFLPVKMDAQPAKILGPLQADATPLDYAQLYINEPLVDIIVTETNRYAYQHIANNVIPPHLSVNQWQPITD